MSHFLTEFELTLLSFKVLNRFNIRFGETTLEACFALDLLDWGVIDDFDLKAELFMFDILFEIS